MWTLRCHPDRLAAQPVSTIGARHGSRCEQDSFAAPAWLLLGLVDWEEPVASDALPAAHRDGSHVLVDTAQGRREVANVERHPRVPITTSSD